MFLHTNAVESPLDLCLNEHQFNADQVYRVQNFKVGDVILQHDSKYGAKRPHIKLFQSSYFTSVKETRGDVDIN